jgi:serine O-acetyltransferase
MAATASVMKSSGIAAPVSATTPDWSREAVGAWEWNPGRQLLRAIRAYQALTGRHDSSAVGRRKVILASYRFWSSISGADIPINTVIAGGLLVPHPNGIVIHPEAVIGPNCLLFQQVTLGSLGTVEGVPRLGGHVDVGAGAKLLGAITVGDHARIGANAVVLRDVPPGATALGIPAVIHPRGS